MGSTESAVVNQALVTEMMIAQGHSTVFSRAHSAFRIHTVYVDPSVYTFSFRHYYRVASTIWHTQTWHILLQYA